MTITADTTTTTSELTDELATVLEAADPTTGLIGEDAAPSGTHAATLAVLSVLHRLGYVHATHDGGYVIERAGREALTARAVARENEARRKLAASYAAVVAELHDIADAIDEMSVTGLAALTVDLQISTRYSRGATDAVKVATVNAVSRSVLDKTGETRQLGSSTTWQHKAEATRGPVKVEVAAFVDDPTARERELAEREREAEVERLRAELAEANRLLATASSTP